MKTNAPFVEKEKTEFDATLPIHDSAGKVIGTVGMDFKLEAGLTKESVTRQAQQIVAEVEKRIASRDQLFEPAK
jgi:hypothetical protein